MEFALMQQPSHINTKHPCPGPPPHPHQAHAPRLRLRGGVHQVPHRGLGHPPAQGLRVERRVSECSVAGDNNMSILLTGLVTSLW